MGNSDFRGGVLAASAKVSGNRMELAVSLVALAAWALVSTPAAALAPTTAVAMKFRRDTSLAGSCERCLFPVAPINAPFAWLAARAAICHWLSRIPECLTADLQCRLIPRSRDYDR